METAQKRRKILIVDDHDLLRSMLNVVLEEEYEVLMAESAEEGLRIFRNSTPDVVLMDIVMPGESGLDALRTIRNLDNEVSVIMMTGFPKLETAEEAISLGANYYLEKPLQPENVRRVIRESIGQTRERRRHLATEEEMKGMIWDLTKSLEHQKESSGNAEPAVHLMHDLMVPLKKTMRSIDELAGQLKGGATPIGTEASLNLVANEVGHCLELVKMCKSLTAEKEEYFEKINAAFLLHEIVDEISQWASQTGIRLDARLLLQRGTIMGRPKQLKCALKTVLSNGVIAVAETKGIVRVACREEKSSVSLRIEYFDGGEDLEKIFRDLGKPYRLGDVQHGLGLGVAIPARVVKEHSGEMHIQSAPDKATVIYITLPLV